MLSWDVLLKIMCLDIVGVLFKIDCMCIGDLECFFSFEVVIVVIEIIPPLLCERVGGGCCVK